MMLLKTARVVYAGVWVGSYTKSHPAGPGVLILKSLILKSLKLKNQHIHNGQYNQNFPIIN